MDIRISQFVGSYSVLDFVHESIDGSELPNNYCRPDEKSNNIPNCSSSSISSAILHGGVDTPNDIQHERNEGDNEPQFAFPVVSLEWDLHRLEISVFWTTTKSLYLFTNIWIFLNYLLSSNKKNNWNYQITNQQDLGHNPENEESVIRIRLGYSQSDYDYGYTLSDLLWGRVSTNNRLLATSFENNKQYKSNSSTSFSNYILELNSNTTYLRYWKWPRLWFQSVRYSNSTDSSPSLLFTALRCYLQLTGSLITFKPKWNFFYLYTFLECRSNCGSVYHWPGEACCMHVVNMGSVRFGKIHNTVNPIEWNLFTATSRGRAAAVGLCFFWYYSAVMPIVRVRASISIWAQ